ncbi:MAG: PTS sugar transporter subunit IIB [Lachnospiraceae bacterium]
MTNIVLFCAAGMSTSLLTNKMKEAAAQMDFACTIEAYPMNQAELIGPTADVILLGPQVRHQMKSIAAVCPDVPIAVIDMVAYGMIDGKKVIQQVQKMQAQ